MSYLWEKAKRGLEAAAHQRDRANQPKRQRFSVKAAVAAHLGEDSATIDEERRYQSTRTPCPVYTVGDDYLTATSSLRPGPRCSKEWPAWELCSDDSYAAAMGWRIWKAKL